MYAGLGIGVIVGGTGASIAPCRVVTPDTGATGVSKQVIQSTTAGGLAWGIATEAQKGTPGVTGSDVTIAGQTGDPIEVRWPGQVALAEFGASASLGQELVSDANGRLVPITNNGGSPANQFVIAWCIEAVTQVGSVFPRLPVFLQAYWRYY